MAQMMINFSYFGKVIESLNFISLTNKIQTHCLDDSNRKIPVPSPWKLITAEVNENRAAYWLLSIPLPANHYGDAGDAIHYTYRDISVNRDQMWFPRA